MICEYSLFEFKSFHKSYLNDVTGAMNSIKLLLRCTIVLHQFYWAFWLKPFKEITSYCHDLKAVATSKTRSWL